MTTTIQFEKQTKNLIDDLKSVCANYGLGNDGNEFKIITQVFLYKFLNDKFIHEVKKLDNSIAKADNWEDVLKSYNDEDYEMLMMQINESTARIQTSQLSRLYLNGRTNLTLPKSLIIPYWILPRKTAIYSRY